MTKEEKLFALSNRIISDLHNEIMSWLKDFKTKNSRPMTLDEAKSLVASLASNVGPELDNKAIEIWCYETADDNPDLIQC